MKVWGRVVKGTKTVFQKQLEDSCPVGANFHDKLENCLIGFCKEADIPVPVWLTKNTEELGRFGMVVFISEQFTEKVSFDRFELKILEK